MISNEGPQEIGDDNGKDRGLSVRSSAVRVGGGAAVFVAVSLPRLPASKRRRVCRGDARACRRVSRHQRSAQALSQLERRRQPSDASILSGVRVPAVHPRLGPAGDRRPSGRQPRRPQRVSPRGRHLRQKRPALGPHEPGSAQAPDLSAGPSLHARRGEPGYRGSGSPMVSRPSSIAMMLNSPKQVMNAVSRLKLSPNAPTKSPATSGRPYLPISAIDGLPPSNSVIAGFSTSE